MADQPIVERKWEMTMRSQPGARIFELQSLRFVAAFVVMFGHVLMEMRQHGDSAVSDRIYFLPWGGGVDIFFIISGFIIYHIGANLPQTWSAALDFMLRRFIRIAPVYWIFTLLMVGVAVAMPGKVQGGVPHLGELLQSLFFLPYRPEGSEVVRPILAQGWTLNYEFFFYLLFALSLPLTRRRFIPLTIALVLLAILGTIVAWPPVIEFLFGPFIILFAAGMALARFRDRLPVHGSVVALTLIIGSLVAACVMSGGYWNDIWLRMVTRGLPAFVMVYAMLRWRAAPAWVTGGPMPLLGDASYALYLSHPFVVNIVLIVFGRLGMPIDNIFLILASLAAIVVSVFVFLLIEQPLLRFGNAAYKRTPISGRAREAAMPAPVEARW